MGPVNHSSIDITDEQQDDDIQFISLGPGRPSRNSSSNNAGSTFADATKTQCTISSFPGNPSSFDSSSAHQRQEVQSKDLAKLNRTLSQATTVTRPTRTLPSHSMPSTGNNTSLIGNATASGMDRQNKRARDDHGWMQNKRQAQHLSGPREDSNQGIWIENDDGRLVQLIDMTEDVRSEWTARNEAMQRATEAHIHVLNPSRTNIGENRPFDLIELSDDENETFLRESEHIPATEGVVLDADDFYKDLEEVTFSRADPIGRRGSKRQVSAVTRLRNASISPPRYFCDELKSTSGHILRKNKTAILKDDSFLRIISLVSDRSTGKCSVRGYRLVRARDMNGMMPKKLNELILVFEIDSDDTRDPLEQCVSEVPVEDIVGVKNVRLTNASFPEHSFRDDSSRSSGYRDTEAVHSQAPFVVRWKYVCRFPTAQLRELNRHVDRCIEHFRVEDIKRFKKMDFHVVDAIRRENYRGNGRTVLGGDYAPKQVISVNEENSASNEYISIDLTSEPDNEPSETELVERQIANTSLGEGSGRVNKKPDCTTKRAFSGHNIIDLLDYDTAVPPSGLVNACSSTPEPRTVLRLGQKYTYGDCFCGVGGATRGAKMAGLYIKYGFDMWLHACEVWGLNFPGARNFCMPADRIVCQALGEPDKYNFMVDILHMSPPCQFWSPAHTIPGQSDEQNQAALFACGELLKIAKPRIVTLEQTFGILSVRFRQFFNRLIQMFTDQGYSLRWKVVPLQDWGLPQHRDRLLMIGAGPGEKLPDFPCNTHEDKTKSPCTDLKPWTSVNSVIRSIPLGTPDHNPYAMDRKNFAPWDGDKTAPHTITCSGGQNYHPSGLRDFTLREYACLQGFPIYHKFMAPYIKKSIGNAVPPSIAEVLFRHIRQHLEKEDGVIREAIMVDDD